MTGVEWILLLIGSVFMIGSFFVTEKLSPSELNKIAELSEEELTKIIDRGLERAGVRVEDAINEEIEAVAEKVDRALEKETNDKIMAISEYSDTVVEGMNKTHNEIMFLYSMLNDKHTELTGMVSDLQRLAADIRNLEENRPMPVEQPVSQMIPEQEPSEPVMVLEEQIPGKIEGESEGQSGKTNFNEEILALHKEGLSDVEIARKLEMGIGEVRLVIGLYRGE